MAANISQANREVAVASPLGDDTLAFGSMVATERLGRLFDIELEVVSEDDAIKPADLLGENMTVRLNQVDGDPRYFNGFVTRFQQRPGSGRLFRYALTLKPWLWFLTRTSDCQIFQEKTVPDVIKEVFRNHGFSDFEDRLTGSYRTWDYCVQYRETDFNFVSRLMEQEGFYYYFTHENGKHTLVLADSLSGHDPLPLNGNLGFAPDGNVGGREGATMYSWHMTQQIQPGAYALRSFDFEKPKASLEVAAAAPDGHASDGFEIFDYEPEYLTTGDGDSYVNKRLEERKAQFSIFDGESSARDLLAGGRFQLEGHERTELNTEYLVVAVEHRIGGQIYENAAAAEEKHSCSVEAITAQTQYRSPRITPKPEIRGPQTAIVVGKSGEEIWTDEHGRVKLMFHWDRYSKADENSSCWVRVASSWAGQNWGAIALPRIGHEVIVEFLEADPDQPIVVGRVYNGSNKPPYALPANATRSTTKSNSSKGGEGFNELRFEDKKGEEQVFLHSEKDLDVRAKNDRREQIGNDRNLVVERHKVETVKGERHEKVTLDHKEELGKDRHLTIQGMQAQEVTKSYSLKVGEDVSYVFEKNHSQVVTKDSYITASNIVIEAKDNITLKVGGSVIAIDKSGIKIETSGMVMQKSGSTFNVQAGAALSLKGGAIVEINGPMVKIN
ncbi:MAG: type VI secretion system tip protein TssI/VgrG [Pseudomonadota bacterium]